MDKYAKAVESSYKYTKESPDSANEFVSSHLADYHIHPQLSDHNSTVLHNSKTNEIIIAYRGTVHPHENLIQSLKDYGADAEIALGMHKFIETPRLHEAETKYERVRSIFPEANIKVAGHSLGAVESYHVATKKNIEGHHFNVGTGLYESPLNRIQSLYHNGDEAYDKQNIYHASRYKALGNIYVGDDPISEGSKYLPGKHHTIKVNTPTNLRTHALNNFYRLENPKKVERIEYKSHFKPLEVEANHLRIKSKKKVRWVK